MHYFAIYTTNKVLFMSNCQKMRRDATFLSKDSNSAGSITQDVFFLIRRQTFPHVNHSNIIDLNGVFELSSIGFTSSKFVTQCRISEFIS